MDKGQKSSKQEVNKRKAEAIAVERRPKAAAGARSKQMEAYLLEVGEHGVQLLDHVVAREDLGLRHHRRVHRRVHLKLHTRR